MLLNYSKVVFTFISVTGYLVVLSRPVICEEFSQCYDDVNICFWTDGAMYTKDEAQTTACRPRQGDYFLPRITNSDIQSKLVEFRAAAPQNLLGSSNIWIGIRSVGSTKFRWIDGSSFSGQLVSTRVWLHDANLITFASCANCER